MGSWIWIAVFVGLFWLLHQSGMGCCGGHSHRHGEGGEDPGGSEKPAHRDENREVAKGVG